MLAFGGGLAGGHKGRGRALVFGPQQCFHQRGVFPVAQPGKIARQAAHADHKRVAALVCFAQRGQIVDIVIIVGPGVADIEDAFAGPQVKAAVAAVIDDQGAVVKAALNVERQIPRHDVVV